MARNARIREEFDPARAFQVVRPFNFSGKRFEVNEMFNKTLATTRRLQQLYDSRYLRMTEDNEDEAPIIEVVKPTFSSFSDQELVTWLQSNGVVPKVGASRETLLKRANALWDRLFSTQSPKADEKKTA